MKNSADNSPFGCPTLTVHIGTHKTGSSSIQLAALANRDRLAAAGVHVVRTGSGNYQGPHYNLAYELTDRSEFRVNKGTIEEAETEIASCDLPDALISAESLSGSAEHLAKYTRLRTLADRLGRRLRIIIYLREQLSYLNSIYAFRVRRLAHHKEFEPFIRRTMGHSRMRYPGLLSPWREIADDLVVFKFGSDVVDRFFGLWGIEIRGQFHINTSIGPKTVEVHRSILQELERKFGRERASAAVGRFRKTENRFLEHTNALGWNEQNFWGFDSVLSDELRTLYQSDNDELRQHYGIGFDSQSSPRQNNRLEVSSLTGAEAAEYTDCRNRLWRMLEALTIRNPRPGSAP